MFLEDNEVVCVSILWGRNRYGNRPDEEMPVAKETAKLLEMVEGTENVERMDALLSLAVTGGDYEWIDHRILIGAGRFTAIYHREKRYK